MAQTETNGEKKPETSKSSEKKEKPQTKVIIRRLPPSIDLATFLNQISPCPDYSYIYLAKGDSSLKENCFSRVYINFVKHEDVYDFKERFDNYVFVDQRGQEFAAVVEFASFQKVPKKRGKARVDPKSNSIESDPIYLEFVEAINKPHEQDEKPEYTLQLTNENKNDTSTPLLEYIKTKRAERLRFKENRREERRRKEIERKKGREEERRKNNEDKSVVVIKPNKKHQKADDSKAEEKHEDDEEGLEKDLEKLDITEDKEKPPVVYERSSYYKNKEKKYEDKRKERKYNKDHDKHDKHEEKRPYRDYRQRYDDYGNKKERKDKFDPRKADRQEHQVKEETKAPKKVKKYSEKREERKIEAQQKAEQRKLEQERSNNNNKAEDGDKGKPDKAEQAEASGPAGDGKHVEKEHKHHHRDKEDKDQRRIRNKDRPAMTLYRPGMLSKSKAKQSDGDEK